MWDNETDLTTSGLFVKANDKKQLTPKEIASRTIGGASLWSPFKGEVSGKDVKVYFNGNGIIFSTGIERPLEYEFDYIASNFRCPTCSVCGETLTYFNAHPRDNPYRVDQMGDSYSPEQCLVWMSNSPHCNRCDMLQTFFEACVSTEYEEYDEYQYSLEKYLFEGVFI